MSFYKIDDNTIMYSELLFVKEDSVIVIVSLKTGEHTYALVDNDGKVWDKLSRMAI